MPKIICTVPAHTPKAQILQSQAAFTALYAEHFGSAKGLTIVWMLTPAGQTFQAGQPADIYLAMIEVENDLAQRIREPAMWAFTLRWAKILAIDINRLMVTCADSRTVNAYLSQHRQRLRPICRVPFLLASLYHLLRSRRANGFAQLRINL